MNFPWLSTIFHNFSFVVNHVFPFFAFFFLSLFQCVLLKQDCMFAALFLARVFVAHRLALTITVTRLFLDLFSKMPSGIFAAFHEVSTAFHESSWTDVSSLLIPAKFPSASKAPTVLISVQLPSSALSSSRSTSARQSTPVSSRVRSPSQLLTPPPSSFAVCLFVRAPRTSSQTLSLVPYVHKFP